MSDQRFLGNLDDPRTFSPEKKKLLDQLQFDWEKYKRRPAKQNKKRPPAKRKKRRSAKRQKTSTAATSGVQKNVHLQVETSSIHPAWLAWYNKAEELYTRHDGHLQVPSRTCLGKWLNVQRARAKRGVFPAERKKLLDRLGSQWTIPVISAAWMSRYNEARAFTARHGQVPGGSPLKKWIWNLRSFLKNDNYPPEKKDLEKNGFGSNSVPTCAHHPSTLEKPAIESGGKSMEKRIVLSPSTEERYEEMDGPVPNVLFQGETSTITDAWMARYKKLKEIHTRYGHIRVLRGKLLQQWIRRERAKAKGGTYPPGKKELSDQLGFQSILPIISPTWMARYDEVKAFKTRHGYLRVPSQKGFGEWFRRERAKAMLEGYSTEKKELFERLGFEWRKLSPRHSATSGEPENVDDSDAYHHNSGVLGIDLSPLPIDRRAEERNHILPKKLLQGKPSPITPAWMARYNEAKEFKVQHEHLQFPRNTQLSNWLHWLRRTNVQGTLAAQKKALLDELGIQWIFPVLSSKWLAGYNEAKTFHTRHGHLQGVPTQTPLGKWLRMQRAYAKARAYPAEKKELLHSLGF
jgi:hypothetical protein